MWAVFLVEVDLPLIPHHLYPQHRPQLQIALLLATVLALAAKTIWPNANTAEQIPTIHFSPMSLAAFWLPENVYREPVVPPTTTFIVLHMKVHQPPSPVPFAFVSLYRRSTRMSTKRRTCNVIYIYIYIIEYNNLECTHIHNLYVLFAPRNRIIFYEYTHWSFPYTRNKIARFIWCYFVWCKKRHFGNDLHLG